MTINELLQTAQFLVDAHGKKKSVLLDYATWQKLVALLEKQEAARPVEGGQTLPGAEVAAAERAELPEDELPVHKAVYDQLIAVAKSGGITTYSDIAPLADLDMGDADDRKRMGEILGEISIYENSEHRPLLSVVVIQRQNGMPGAGFFNLARRLGVHHGNDDATFFVEELRRVYEYWRQA